MNFEYIYGVQPIIEVLKLKKRKFYELYYSSRSSSPEIQNIFQLAKEASLIVKEFHRDKLSQLCGHDFHQGFVLKATQYPYVFEQEWNVYIEQSSELLLLILDQIQDPQNLGAILRTAHCVGVDIVFIPERRSCELSPLVLKTSAGAAEHLKVTKVTNLARLIEFLKEVPVWIYGADATSKVNYTQPNYKGHVAWVMGNEGEGIRSLVKQRCDQLVSIPMKGKIDSLNVSVATAVLLYETLRQRMF